MIALIARRLRSRPSVERRREVIQTEKAQAPYFNWDRTRPTITASSAAASSMSSSSRCCPFRAPSSFGAGHISKTSRRSPRCAGFATVVVDRNRDTFASRERFPEAAEVHAAEYEEVFPNLQINETSYVIIVTRRPSRRHARAEAGHCRHPRATHRHDRQQRKVLNVIRELEKEGIPRARLQRSPCPHGPEYRRRFSEEIAISVAAEMIAVRRGAASNWRSLSMSVFADESLRAVLAK